MHQQFLLKALEQAKKGLGHCAPNPCVGAVAVQNGTIIAAAFHHGAGTPHAEQLLLAQLPPKLLGVSVYVTLEPCNHWGRTPPCINALIDYGVERVIFAYFDPNPLVANNNSSQQLREKGIEVLHIPLPEIDAFYTSYTQWIKTGLPRVTVKIAQSLDGKLGKDKGPRLILSNELCEEFTHEQRAQSDVILTTAHTVLADNPRLTVRLNHEEQKKTIAILDSQLSIPEDALIVTTAQNILFYHSDEVKPPTHRMPHCHYQAIPSQKNQLALDVVINHLGSLGYHDVWVEAGGGLFSALHQKHLVDKTYIYIAPCYVGANALSAWQCEGSPFTRQHQITWLLKGNNVILCIDWLEDACLQD